MPQPGVCAGGPRPGPGVPVRHPVSRAAGGDRPDQRDGPHARAACDTTAAAQRDPLGNAHAGTCRGVGGPREGLWCDLDGDCPGELPDAVDLRQRPERGPGLRPRHATATRSTSAPAASSTSARGRRCFTQSGTYGAGDLELTIPMTVEVSRPASARTASTAPVTTPTRSAAPASTACSASPPARPPRRSATSTTRTASRWAPRSTARPSAATAWENNEGSLGRPAGGRRHVPERAVHPVHPRHHPHVPLRRRQSALRG